MSFIYRSTQQAIVEDFSTLLEPSKILEGGRHIGNVYVYEVASAKTLPAYYTGFSMLAGSFIVDSETYTAGNYALIQSGIDSLAIHRQDSAGVMIEVATLTKEEGGTEFSILFTEGAIITLAVQSPTAQVTVVDLPIGTKFDGIEEINGVVTFEQIEPVKTTTQYVINDLGTRIGETFERYFPGDTLRYVPVDYNLQPSGSGYEYRVAATSLQGKWDALERAFSNGGLQLIGPPLPPLVPLTGSQFTPQGSVIYRLTDPGTQLDIQVIVIANSQALGLSFVIKGKSYSINLPHTCVITAKPFGFAIGGGTSNQYEAVGFERNGEDLFFYKLGTSPEQGVHEMPYVLPGPAKKLISAGYRVRRSAGPWRLLNGELDTQTQLVTLAGAADVEQGEVVELADEQGVAQYGVLGTSKLSDRLAILIRT